MSANMEKIAVIEDDPGIRTVIRLALKGAGRSFDLNGKVVYDSTGQDLPSHAARAEFEAVKSDGRARNVVSKPGDGAAFKLVF